MSKILALDLASRQSGWAVFEKGTPSKLIDKGIIEPRPRSLSAEERLPIIEKELQEILDKYKPSLVILEQPAGGKEDSRGPDKSWLTMSVLFLCHGVVRNELIKRKIKFQLCSPSVWQNRLGFHKRDRAGRKAAAREYAVKAYSLPDNLEQDIYDAVCLYDCYIYLEEFKKKEKEEERSAF